MVVQLLVRLYGRALCSLNRSVDAPLAVLQRHEEISCHSAEGGDLAGLLHLNLRLASNRKDQPVNRLSSS